MFTSRFRRRRYNKLLEKYPLDDPSPYRKAKNLTQVWRRVRWSDFSSLPSDVLLGRRFMSSHRNLIHLIESYEKQNQYIAETRELKLEAGNTLFNDIKPISLDTFFSDDNMVAIDVNRQLRSFIGQLQILYCSIEDEYKEDGGDYFARMSDFLIRDSIAFTEEILRSDADYR